MKLKIIFILIFFGTTALAASNRNNSEICLVTNQSQPIYRDYISASGKIATKLTGYLAEGDFFSCPKGSATLKKIPIISTEIDGATYLLNDSSTKKFKLQKTNFKELHPADKAVEAYIEDLPNKRFQIFKSPGSSWQTVEKKPDERAAYINLEKPENQQNLYYISETKWAEDYYDPIQHQKTSRMFYKLNVVKNTDKEKYLKGDHVEVTQGWADSMIIRATPLEVEGSAQNKKTQAHICRTCPSSGGPEREKEKIEQLKKSILELRQNKIIAELRANDCPEKNKRNAIRLSKRKENLLSGFIKICKQKFTKIAAPKRVSSSTANAATLEQNLNLQVNEKIAIDALARTLYGEMRSCHNNIGARYSKAVTKVIINRAEHCQRTNCSVALGNTKGKNLADAVLAVLEKPAQFSTWNKNDPNIDDILCIQKNPVDQKIWAETVKIATDAIMNTEKFKLETKTIDSNVYHYVSLGSLKGREPSWTRNKTRAKGIRIDGLPVDSTRCFKAYKTSPGQYVFVSPDAYLNPSGS